MVYLHSGELAMENGTFDVPIEDEFTRPSLYLPKDIKHTMGKWTLIIWV